MSKNKGRRDFRVNTLVKVIATYCRGYGVFFFIPIKQVRDDDRLDNLPRDWSFVRLGIKKIVEQIILLNIRNFFTINPLSDVYQVFIGHSMIDKIGHQIF